MAEPRQCNKSDDGSVQAVVNVCVLAESISPPAVAYRVLYLWHRSDVLLTVIGQIEEHFSPLRLALGSFGTTPEIPQLDLHNYVFSAAHD